MTAGPTIAVASGRGAIPDNLRRCLHQFRYDLRAFLRNGQSRFFTLALPVMFLLIFGSVFGGHDKTVKVGGGRLDTSVAYVPGIMALGIISASLVNLVITITAQRESGVLKRRRATPMPAGAIIAARALTAMVTALAMTGVLLVIGWLAFGADVPARTAPALVITVLLGAAVFCCLGFALARSSTMRTPPSRSPRRRCFRSTSYPGCSSRRALCRIGWSTSLPSFQSNTWPQRS